jgi:hypothetical protein
MTVSLEPPEHEQDNNASHTHTYIIHTYTYTYTHIHIKHTQTHSHQAHTDTFTSSTHRHIHIKPDTYVSHTYDNFVLMVCAYDHFVLMICAYDHFALIMCTQRADALHTRTPNLKAYTLNPTPQTLNAARRCPTHRNTRRTTNWCASPTILSTNSSRCC